jgi:multiple sugar transport system substrate-binding protein
MRNKFRMPPALATLATLAMVAVVGCGSTAATPTAAPVATPAPTDVPVATAPPAATPAPSVAFSAGTDDGKTITMWTRAATQFQATALVAAYNATHKNQVNLTIVPTDDMQAKVGAAAGAGSLPDIISGDVVFMPNWTSQGLFTDITSKISALPFASTLASGPIKASTTAGKAYGVPFIMDLSVWVYNKDLFTKAGLDPNKPPTTLKEFDTDARAVNKLGGSVKGSFFGGNCGGCEVFTWWPSIWADGQQVMSADGTSSMLNSDEAKAVYAIYAGEFKDGIVAASSKTETGPTWVSFFPKGNIGIMPYPGSLLGSIPSTVNFGVAPIAGLNGGQSTFVGGDAVGITANSKVSDEAWNFLAWTLSDYAQVEIVAKGGNIVARSDLANNKYAAADPRTVTVAQVAAKGVTPLAKNFGQTFNDPNGPWLVLTRDAVFNGASSSKIDSDNAAVTKSLAGQ